MPIEACNCRRRVGHSLGCKPQPTETLWIADCSTPDTSENLRHFGAAIAIARRRPDAIASTGGGGAGESATRPKNAVRDVQLRWSGVAIWRESNRRIRRQRVQKVVHWWIRHLQQRRPRTSRDGVIYSIGNGLPPA
jgi:hypothetical protein